MKILGISGSLRAGSFNTALLKVAAELAQKAGVKFEIYDISDIPFYNSDLDADNKPDAVVKFNAAIKNADGLLFSTPEYNYSIPGVLKNAIDWASRPGFNAALTKKPCGIVSASMSTLGGARAQIHLRDILFGTLSPVHLAAEFLLASAHKAFDENGKLTDQKTEEFLDKYIQSYVDWLKTIKNK